MIQFKDKIIRLKDIQLLQFLLKQVLLNGFKIAIPLEIW